MNGESLNIPNDKMAPGAGAGPRGQEAGQGGLPGRVHKAGRDGQTAGSEPGLNNFRNNMKGRPFMAVLFFLTLDEYYDILI